MYIEKSFFYIFLIIINLFIINKLNNSLSNDRMYLFLNLIMKNFEKNKIRHFYLLFVII